MERLVFHQTWVEVCTPEQTGSEGGELSDVWEAELTELREGVADSLGKGCIRADYQISGLKNWVEGCHLLRWQTWGEQLWESEQEFSFEQDSCFDLPG